MTQLHNFAIKIPWISTFRRPMSPPSFIPSPSIVLSVIFLLLFSCKESRNEDLLLTKPDEQLSTSSEVGRQDNKVVPASCPQGNLLLTFQGYAPKIGLDFHPDGEEVEEKKIVYERLTSAQTVEQCVDACCGEGNCNAAFFYISSQRACFMVKCIKNEYCVPSKLDTLSSDSETSLVLVRTPEPETTWQDAINEYGEGFPLPKTACDATQEGQVVCGAHQVCKSVSGDGNGVCMCIQGFVLDSSGATCILEDSEVASHNEVVKLVIKVESKEITLPDHKTTLSAIVVPEESSDKPYTYAWSLVNDKDKNFAGGSMGDAHEKTLSLMNLEVGVYRLKVVVTDGQTPPGAYGEGFANVTVVKPRRINEKPIARVVPANHTVTLPTSSHVIDGSTSTDDGDPEMLKFKWDVAKKPIGYVEKPLPKESTLTLTDLMEGDYKIILTVTDEEGESSSATALLSVFPATNFPPIANAGDDVVIYLPKNEVILNGNRSVDDHGIVTYEWKYSGDQEFTADTINMSTAYPRISNLDTGAYTFTLTVTDANGASASDSVAVYVKPPTNTPPKADAGEDISINLPRNWVILDGNHSTDDFGVISYAWKQISGPNSASLVALAFDVKNSSRMNATGLTKGSYSFQLTVEDAAGNEDVDVVSVTVKHDKNAAPIAKAGDDVIVSLPQSVVILNGSGSSDDLRIARWQWTREPESLAAGEIIGNTSREAILYLVNLIPGRYVFRLQVWDDQGKSNEDKIAIKVLENPNMMNIVVAMIKEDITVITANRLETFHQGLGLMLRNAADEVTKGHSHEVNVKILKIDRLWYSGYTVVEFIVELLMPKNEPNIFMPAPKVVSSLKKKLERSSDLLELEILDFDTAVCQNTCSGHGVCHQATRECHCEPFWIENFMRRYLMDGKRNCEWSVIYVAILMSIFAFAIICASSILCCKKKPVRAKITAMSNKARQKGSRLKNRYSRLEQNEHGIELRSAHTSSLMISDSESESDDLFDLDSLGEKKKFDSSSMNLRLVTTCDEDIKHNGSEDAKKRNVSSQLPSLSTVIRRSNGAAVNISEDNHHNT